MSEQSFGCNPAVRGVVCPRERHADATVKRAGDGALSAWAGKPGFTRAHSEAEGRRFLLGRRPSFLALRVLYTLAGL